MSKGNYEDIMQIPYPKTNHRTRMSQRDRAAQFAPFAALCGHMEAIEETQRITEKEKRLDEDQKIVLDEKLQAIMTNIDQHPMINVTYFKPDEKKKGGVYTTVVKRIRKVDACLRVIEFEDRSHVAMEQIIDLQQVSKDS